MKLYVNIKISNRYIYFSFFNNKFGIFSKIIFIKNKNLFSNLKSYIIDLLIESGLVKMN